MVKETSELRRIGIDPLRFREVFEARNGFYRACWEEEELSAIGFDESDEFPIGRKDFSRLQVTLIERESTPDLESATAEIMTVTVTSPNWDRGDTSRTWRGKEVSGRYRLFKVDDEGFWALASCDRLDLRGQDTMKVQWAYQGEGSKRKNYRVLRVLEYNGDKLADPLDTDAIEAMIGPHADGAVGQDDLFG